MNKPLLITGGCGFIGSNFVHYMRRAHRDIPLINLDRLTYSGNADNLMTLQDDPAYRFVHGDIADEGLLKTLFQETGIQGIVHFAAESHVDRSILEAEAFVQTNVVGTHRLLETARQYWVKALSRDALFRFVHVSTDEVYGTLGEKGLFSEESPFRPNSPYAATKAAADLLVRAYFETYGLPVVTARPSNNYGPYQFPEKFIPLMITNLMENQPVPLYGKGLNVRDWIFVEDTCRAIDSVRREGRPGEAYNVGGETEKQNIEVAEEVLSIFGKPSSYLTFVEDRPGHDLRYALDNGKIRRDLGWQPATTFKDGLEQTVSWYRENRGWWEPLKERLSRESRGFWSQS